MEELGGDGTLSSNSEAFFFFNADSILFWIIKISNTASSRCHNTSTNTPTYIKMSQHVPYIVKNTHAKASVRIFKIGLTSISFQSDTEFSDID